MLDNVLDVLYGGAAGGGKSDALLMASLQYVDVPGYSALIARDTYQNLAKPGAIMDRAIDWLYGKAHWDDQDKRFTFASGATLTFTYLEHPRAHLAHQGAEYQFVGIDEAAAVREYQALYLFSRLRKLSGSAVPLRFRCASNPPSREQAVTGAWVKKRYIDPRTRLKDTVFISAKMDDNPHLDHATYELSLSKLDQVTHRQLRHGDWDISNADSFMRREDFVIIDHPMEAVQTCRYWDLAATEDKDDKTRNKEGGGPAYTSGVKMSRTPQGIYVIEHVARVRRDPPQVESAMRSCAEGDGRHVMIRQEQEPGSSGKHVISHIRRNVLPAWNYDGERPTGDKLSRAMPFITHVEAHNVCLVRGNWNDAFIDEAEVFPSGPYKDQIDAAAGAHRMLAGGAPSADSF